MKKLFMLIVVVATFSTLSFGQVPESFNYQAIVRNASNAVISNQSVGMRMTIKQGSANGMEVYSETFSATTNVNGLVNLAIGNGTALTGNFSNIDWSNGPYFIETAVDAAGGSNYAVMGTSQLMSVPYALYAKTSGGGSFVTTPTDPNSISNVNSGNVGIGTSAPTEKMDINGNLRVRQNTTMTGTLDIHPGWSADPFLFPQPSNILLQGQMGIGTYSPTALMNVVGGDRQTGVRVEGGNASVALVSSREYQIYARQEGDLVFYDQTAEQETNGGYPVRIIINSTGKVGIGNQSPTEQLDVSGNIKSSGNVAANGFVKAGGTSSQYLMADGTTSNGPDQLTVGTMEMNSNADGATISNGVLRLAPADLTNGGIMTTSPQFFAGDKSFMGNLHAEGNFSAGQSSATGYQSFALGLWPEASGNYGSLATGNATLASGNVATAMGWKTKAVSFGETAMGMNNTDYSPLSGGDYNAQDRLFVIGNGADENNKSDAMVILKNGTTTVNGNTTINGSTTATSFVKAGGTSSQYLMADGTSSNGPAQLTVGTVETNSNADGATISNGVLRLAPADLTNGGIMTTSPQFFAGDKSFIGNLHAEGNFSAGQSSATGYQSFALGLWPEASGNYGSLATGNATLASGNVATAMGWKTKAVSFGETAMGMNNTDYSPLSGGDYNAQDRLFVIGNGADENNKSDAMVILKNGTTTVNGNTTINGSTTATSFVKAGGTSSQYLMADGSVATGAISSSGNIVSTAYSKSSVGTLATVTAYTFLGSVATVTITAGQKVEVTATAALGTSIVGGATMSRLAIGQKLSTATVISDNGNDWIENTQVGQNTRLPFTLNTIFTGLAAGTYQFGMIYLGTGADWNNNDNSRITVKVINP